jgi:hypothetical protein
MRAEIPQNKTSLRFSTVLKMDTPPFLVVVVQSLRVSCADTRRGHDVSNSTHQGRVGGENFLSEMAPLLLPIAIAASTGYWIWMPQTISSK